MSAFVPDNVNATPEGAGKPGPTDAQAADAAEARAPDPEAAPADDAEAEAAPPDAAERLAASRERMRQWMLSTDKRHAARERMEAALAAGEKPALADRLRHAPVVGVVIDAFSAWWAEHPLQPAAAIAQGVVNRRVAPAVRRHPMAVVLGAFLVGVLLVRLRPWRWIARPAVFAGLGSHFVTRVVRAVPFEKLLAVLGGLAGVTAMGGDDPGPDGPPDPLADPAAYPPQGTRPWQDATSAGTPSSGMAGTAGSAGTAGTAPGAGIEDGAPGPGDPNSPPVPRASLAAETVTP